MRIHYTVYIVHFLRVNLQYNGRGEDNHNNNNNIVYYSYILILLLLIFWARANDENVLSIVAVKCCSVIILLYTTTYYHYYMYAVCACVCVPENTLGTLSVALGLNLNTLCVQLYNIHNVV